MTLMGRRSLAVSLVGAVLIVAHEPTVFQKGRAVAQTYAPESRPVPGGQRRESMARQQSPQSELVRAIQDRAEVDRRLDGALVVDAELQRNETGRGWTLFAVGKVASEDQRPLLEEVIFEALENDPEWRDRVDEIVVDLNAVRTVVPSPAFASRYYVLGLNAFWNCEFAKADLAFLRALAEAPDSEILRYWRVVTAIALGQDERAEIKLRPLLRQNPQGSSDPIIAREFERLQGPLRWRLQALEEHVLLTLVP